MGPAFVAAIAYVDPGNIAANLTAGARYGVMLLWVLVVANLMAVLVQHQSAKLGIVTGLSLAQAVGRRLSRRGRIAYCFQAQLVAVATDIAEVIGGAIALQILFGIPLLLGGVIVGAVSLVLLALRSRGGARLFEHVMLAMLLVIALGFVAGLLVDPPSPRLLAGGLIPRVDGAPSIVLAASMLGATVMPHAIYVHSHLVRDRHAAHEHPGGGSSPRTRRLLRATRWDVALSLVLAGGVNIAMLVLAAQTLSGVDGTDSIEGAHAALEHAAGPVIGTLFAIGLLVSGLASTAVGAHFGAGVLEDLLDVRVPLLARRLITLLPALVLLALGIDPTAALVLSQALLSLGIPFALVPLMRLTRDRELMGEHADGPVATVLTAVTALAIVALNAVLVVLTLTGAA